MRRLKGAIVRTTADHRSADGRRSRAFQEALRQQLGDVPAMGLPLVREACRLDTDLFHLASELDVARQRKRRRDIARLRRQRTPMLGQLQRLLEQIEALAKTARRSVHPFRSLERKDA